ncbi:unnamed protein product [Lactuca saligna]|uniref:Uncharacterized protein n=1 Tax=Lactuca saligna TaxID=75948 RepID=A0AA35XZ83_LACSI|nr:unnamed protein product [Lactuca saligna]
MTSSSVRWSKIETSCLNTEEHHFKINLRRAKNHRKLNLLLVHDITRFSDINASEFGKHIGLRSRSLRFPADVSEAPILPKNVFPFDFNWRVYGVVTNDVNNQDAESPLDLKEAI